MPKEKLSTKRREETGGEKSREETSPARGLRLATILETARREDLNKNKSARNQTFFDEISFPSVVER